MLTECFMIRFATRKINNYKTMESQNNQILNHLQSGRSITPVQALTTYGCFRLAARIHFLKKKGHDIISEIKESPSGKSFARYRLS